MKMTIVKEQLSQIAASQRILLLSHCLRPSQTCPGKFNKQGLVCPEDCTENCVIGRLRRAALHLGYKGVCISPGGRLALKYVQESSPQGIVAVACHKELAEGIRAVKKLASGDGLMPPIVTIPLTTDGCVDTEVDEGEVFRVLNLLPDGDGSQ